MYEELVKVSEIMFMIQSNHLFGRNDVNDFGMCIDKYDYNEYFKL